MNLSLHHGYHLSARSLLKDIGIVEVAVHHLLYQMGKSVLSAVLPFYLIHSLGYSLSDLVVFYFFWQVSKSLVVPYVH